MIEGDADDLVTFRNVRVIRSTAPALFCGIGAQRVWLPRNHISGKLCRAGDRGALLIRRWVARDRHLIDAQGLPVDVPPRPSLLRLRLSTSLRLVPRLPEPRLGY